MNSWPDYLPSRFVNRPAALARILKWANNQAGSRVLVIVGSPGNGKTWLLNKVKEELDRRGQLVLWLDAPILIRQREEQEGTQLFNHEKFREWFDTVHHQAHRVCRHLQPIGVYASAEAQIEALVNMICDCELRYVPILIVDAYDEMSEEQAILLSLRLLDKFLSRPCTRIVMALRSEYLLRGDLLKRHREFLFLEREDPVQLTFARQQFEKWFKEKFPGRPMPDPENWFAGFQHYSWRNPAVNYLLFEQGWREASPRPIERQEVRDAIQAVVQRGGRYSPLDNGKFDLL
ncbi:MAG: NACHT domain-containing protein, partial [Anaerolineales bacterium]|nr:NACHT domain-containing protein [Anaerolineales bacterium]